VVLLALAAGCSAHAAATSPGSDSGADSTGRAPDAGQRHGDDAARMRAMDAPMGKPNRDAGLDSAMDATTRGDADVIPPATDGATPPTSDTGSPTSSSFIFGISMGADETLFNGSDHGAAQYAVMRADGFSAVRIDVGYQTTQPYYDDPTIRAAIAAGLDPLLILDGYNASNITAAQFATFSTQVVSTYEPLGVHRYEVMNEINGNGNWDSTTNYVNPAAYAALLKLVYSAIKSADPAATVILSGLAVFGQTNGADEGNGNYAGMLLPGEFLTLAYAAMNGDSTGYFDAVACHPYSFPSNPDTADNWGVFLNPPGMPGYYGDSVRAIMVANGDSAKKMWITEFGAPTSSETDAQESSAYSSAFTLCEGYDYVAAFYCFNWNDDQDGDFGLNTSSYVPKPALATVESFMDAGL
jgi:Cellulase (glycosyl hydrolase family 5)